MVTWKSIPWKVIVSPLTGPSSYKKSLKANAERLGLFFVDGEKVINKYNLDDYAPKGPHLSIEGYKKFSNYLSEFIKFSNKNHNIPEV